MTGERTVVDKTVAQSDVVIESPLEVNDDGKIQCWVREQPAYDERDDKANVDWEQSVTTHVKEPGGEQRVFVCEGSQLVVGGLVRDFYST